MLADDVQAAAQQGQQVEAQIYPGIPPAQSAGGHKEQQPIDGDHAKDHDDATEAIFIETFLRFLNR
jgi:hypothetical protein